MERKTLNICRNCGTAWLVKYDGRVPFEEYRNLGWRVNCHCGLSNFGSQWCMTEDEAITDWNRCRFSTPLIGDNR